VRDTRRIRRSILVVLFVCALPASKALPAALRIGA